MKELVFVLEERKNIQSEYLREAESIWGSKIETIEKDEKVRRLYNKYRSKDMLLEQIEARLKSCINDIDFYENKYKK